MWSNKTFVSSEFPSINISDSYDPSAISNSGDPPPPPNIVLLFYPYYQYCKFISKKTVTWMNNLHNFSALKILTHSADQFCSILKFTNNFSLNNWLMWCYNIIKTKIIIICHTISFLTIDSYNTRLGDFCDQNVCHCNENHKRGG